MYVKEKRGERIYTCICFYIHTMSLKTYTENTGGSLEGELGVWRSGTECSFLE